MSIYSFLLNYIEQLPASERSDYLINAAWSEKEQAAILQKTSLLLPHELIEFFTFSYAPTLDEYQFFTVPEIELTIQEMQDIYDEDWIDNLIPFARLVGVGDLLLFDPKAFTSEGCVILDGFHELSPEEWKPTCYGLDNWLRQMCQNKFQPFWLK